MTLQATLATWLVEPSENEIVQKYEELQDSNGWAQGPSEWEPVQLHSLSLESAQFLGSPYSAPVYGGVCD